MGSLSEISRENNLCSGTSASTILMQSERDHVKFLRVHTIVIEQSSGRMAANETAEIGLPATRSLE